MTVAKSLPLQGAVYATVVAAIPSIEVFDHAPTNPPTEYVRLDGFNLTDLGFKNGEVARHSFEVHHFLRPSAQVLWRGQSRSKAILAQTHAAIMAAVFLGTAVNFEYMDVQTDEDGVSTHGWARYSIAL